MRRRTDFIRGRTGEGSRRNRTPAASGLVGPTAAAAALLAGALLLSVAPELRAQSVRGVIVADADGRPIEGAFVSLIDAAGAELDGALTAADGGFTLEAPRPGEVRVRVARIGLETWISGRLRLEVRERRTVRYEVPVRPVRLADIDVSVRRQCVRDPAQESDVWRAWAEARKALTTTAHAEREELYRFEIRLHERELSPDGGRVLAVRTRPRLSSATKPFRSLEPARLSEGGYARAEGDSLRYYMPDAEALLSPEFEDDHCFGLRRSEDERPGAIGVTFAPKEDRGVPEIRGVLWLDEASAELRRLEIEYVDLPLGLRDGQAAGSADFARLPTGAFVVRRWWIRMPQVERLEDFSGRLLRERIGSIKEDGGEVMRVFAAEGEPVPLPPEEKPDRAQGRVAPHT